MCKHCGRKIDPKEPLDLILRKCIVNNKPSLEFLIKKLKVYNCSLSCIHTNFLIMRI